MYQNSKGHTGAYVSGEWKVVLALRYLAGAAYLDLYLWSMITPNHIKKIVDLVVIDWFNCDDVLRIYFMKMYCSIILQ